MILGIEWLFFSYMIIPEEMKPASLLLTALMLLLSSTAFADLSSLKEVPLLKPYEAPIVVNGQRVGSIKLPAGASVEIISQQGAEYRVSRGGQIPFNIPKDYIIATPIGNPTIPSQEVIVAKGQLQGIMQLDTGICCSFELIAAKGQPQGIMQQVRAFLAHAKQTALENIAVISGALGITTTPVVSTEKEAQKPQIAAPMNGNNISPETSATITPASAPQVVDHFSSALSAAKSASPREMHLNDAFGLGDLEKAKAKAIREKKPLGFIMVWETKGDFFNYSADTRDKYGPSALQHFYKGFNSNVVLVFVRHEDELGLVPAAVSQGFSGPDEGGYAPNMAVTDATATEFIVEIPARGLEGLSRDTIFAEGAKKIDLWLSTHSDAVTKPQ